MEQIGRSILLLGLVLLGVGGLFLLAGKIPFLGRLPGDIRIEKEHFRFYFPLTTSILISLLLSLLLWLLQWMGKR